VGRWMFGTVLVFAGCVDAPVVDGGTTYDATSGLIEGTGERWQSESSGGESEPPPRVDEPECSARWRVHAEPRVLVDAEFECDSSGFTNEGLSVASLGDSAVVALADAARTWVVRAAADVVAPLPDGPELFQNERLHTTVDANGELVLTGIVRREGELLWEVWAFGTRWRRLVSAGVEPGSSVMGIDASPSGDIAVWLELVGVRAITRARDGWVIQPALDLDEAVPTSSALAADDAEVVVGYSADTDAGTIQPLGRTHGEPAAPLSPAIAGSAKVLLAVPTRGRAFPSHTAPVAALSGTRESLSVLHADGRVPLVDAAMASKGCRLEWDEVAGGDDCEDCWEEGSGRLGQAVSVARTDEGTLLVAYVHANLDRYYRYNYWCSHPDGEYCSCETLILDQGSSFEVRLLAVHRDGQVSAVVALPLQEAPDGRESTGPGDLIDLDAAGDRAAIAVRLGSEPVRVFVVDTSGVDSLAG